VVRSYILLWSGGRRALLLIPFLELSLRKIVLSGRTSTGEPFSCAYFYRRIPMKALIGAILVCAFVTPALAADEYYVVQDVKTKRCSIVDKKPTTTTETTVVGNSVYKTRTEAETGMKSVKVCTAN
jgi:hypothetical protein